MVNVIISPSQQKWNLCAVGNCTEQDHCHLIGQKVYEYLQQYECNCLLIQPIFGTERETLNEVVRQSNLFCNTHATERNYHLDIHTDAGGYAKGASGFYVSEQGKSFILEIWREVSRLTPWGDGACTKRDDLFVLNGTLATAGLIEVSFHDSEEESKWMHMNIDQIGQAICRGIVNNLGLKLRSGMVQDWRINALRFAVESKISDGTRPRDFATREEVWAMLMNYNKM